MQTTKRDEHRRNYRLKSERCQHSIDAIGEEYLDTLAASHGWQLVIDAARSRLERLKGELIQCVKDRRTPGVIQPDLQRTIYAVLTEISKPEFVNRALGTRKTKRGRR